MGITLDAISGENLIDVVKTNLPNAFDLSGKGVTEFVDGIKAKAGSDKISVLRIWSHGVTHYSDERQTPYNKGNVLIGRDKIDFDSIGQFESPLRNLTPLFERGARVELRGCQAALGSGAKMMLRMADIWKAEVQGSDRSQPLVTWTPPVYSALPGATSLKSAVIIEYNEKPAKK
jgi:hypothetical protein